MKLYTIICFLTIAPTFNLHAQNKTSNQAIIIPYKIPLVLKPALESVNKERIFSHIKILSSDKFEGRAPGTTGDTLTVNYVTNQFLKIGLKAGNPNGTYAQEVPMIGFKTQKASLSITINGKTDELQFPNDFAAWSGMKMLIDSVKNSEIIFAGYGIVASEYGWDDYKNIDVKGKTVVVLDTEPLYKDASDTSKIDTLFFKGKAKTSYAFARYKINLATEKGAACLLIVHVPQNSFGPFEVYKTSILSELIEIKSSGSTQPMLMAGGYMTLDAFIRTCKDLNKDAVQLMLMAMHPNFVPVTLPGYVNLKVDTRLREFTSRNVVAKIEGSDKNLKNEYVIYSAHWDHLGKDTTLKGDQIYNGAADNASGVAEILEIANGFSRLKIKPKRTILFIATTAEEVGMVGSRYYATHPLYPISKTLADINIDETNLWGRTKDVWVAGEGLTTIDEILKQTAAAQNRILVDSPDVNSFFLRSDQIEFAKVGIPSIFPSFGSKIIGKPEGYSEGKDNEYEKNDYHQVSDEIKPDWDLSGTVEDVQWLLMTGYEIAQGNKYPQWKEGVEFKAKREDMLKTKKEN